MTTILVDGNLAGVDSSTTSGDVDALSTATLTGSSANNFTATLQGVLQQYTIGAGGTTVTGGPEGANDSLVNIQRLQFVDGYETYSPNDNAGEVYRLYEAVLGRAPDHEGLTSWTNELNSGVSLQTVADSFIASTEFQASLSSTAYVDFITLLYDNVLHRAPDQTGINYWYDQLSLGVMSEAQVVVGFTQSPEDIADTAAGVQHGLWVGNTNAAEVARLYDTTLGRLPDLAGLTSWTNALNGGTSLQTVANGFVGSPEFQAKYGALNDTNFVAQLFENALHRAADSAGLYYWSNELSSGAMTRAEVVLGFSDSAEHQADAAAHIDNGIWIV